MIPRVSIIMTVRNGAAYIRETLDAIGVQTFRDFELVINDNGSTDDTPSIVESYARADARIRRIGLAPGEPSTFTQGIARALAAARAPYVAVNDADDISEPSRIEKQVAVLDSDPRVCLVATTFHHIDEYGRPMGCYELPTSHDGVVAALQSRGVIAHSSVMYRREAALAAGGYQQRMTYASDTALWVQMIKQGSRVAVIDEPLVSIRQHAAQTSLMPGQQAQRYLEPLEIFGMAATLPGVSFTSRIQGMIARQKLALRYGWALWQSGSRMAGVARAGYWFVTALGPPLCHVPGFLGYRLNLRKGSDVAGDAQ